MESARICQLRPVQGSHCTESPYGQAKIAVGRLAVPKVLVVGMAKTARLGLDSGGRQHSNALYALTSSTWPLVALRRLLDAGVLELFGVALSPRFSGGTKRFDGHVLSQVHVPAWANVPLMARYALLEPAAAIDAEVVAATYGLAGRQVLASLRGALRRREVAGTTALLREGAA